MLRGPLLSTLLGWVQERSGQPIWFDDAVSQVHLIFAILTPLALFAHGCALFRGWEGRKFGGVEVGLLAAALLATSPHHMRFAASDSFFVPSLLLSSAAFASVYGVADTSLNGRSRWLAQAGGLVAVAALTWLTVSARPLNLLFAPLLLWAAWMATAAERAATGRRWLPIFLGLAVAIELPGISQMVQLATRQSESVQEGLSLHTLLSGLGVLLRPSHNPLTAWLLTPPLWTPLVAWGAWLTLQRQRQRGLFLLAWLLGFIVAHGVVVPENPAMNARYQLHALAPMVLLAAPALHRLLTLLWRHGRDRARGGRVVAAGLVAALALSPLWHRAAIVDADTYVQQERLFYDQLRTMAPPGCVVIERFRPAEQDNPLPRSPRVAERVGGANAGDVRRWPLVPLSRGAADALADYEAVRAGRRLRTPDAIETGDTAAPGGITARPRVSAARDRSERGRLPVTWSAWNPDVDVALRQRCVVFVEGLECSARRTGPGREALCQRLLARGRWRLLAERRLVARWWDPNYAAHLRADGEPFELRVWKRISP